MNKYEKIFALIVIAGYIAMSVFLKIPWDMHLMFISIIGGALIITWLLKLNHDHENEKIRKTALIFAALCVLIDIVIRYINYANPLLSLIMDILFIVFLIIAWIFGKTPTAE